MATIDDIGTPGAPLSDPPLTEWQAAVRDDLKRIADHGNLAGLADDDHPQYLTAERLKEANVVVANVPGLALAYGTIQGTTDTWGVISLGIPNGYLAILATVAQDDGYFAVIRSGLQAGIWSSGTERVANTSVTVNWLAVDIRALGGK